MNHNIADIDPIETQEWLDAINSVIAHEGPERARYLLTKLQEKALGMGGVDAAPTLNTPYINTIPVAATPPYPGDLEIERRIMSILRWNAAAMVLQAGKKAPELGGHIATYASSASLYEVGFNHFFHAPSADHGGDLVYIQGHSSPGIYARSFLEGRLSAEQLANFRQEIDGKGLSSYPHPWLMPDYWQFATVSMGLGPLQGIYQAQFLKYLHHRKLADTAKRKVWVFCGDGEMDEPESIGAIDLAGRDHLDNLIFVINCNLQRLDGPVRGNGKIIQDMETLFRGAGWNVIKVIWGGRWDPLLAQDSDGMLVKLMNDCVDGEYQNFKAKDGAYVRERFFGKHPETKAMVADMSDAAIWALNRGGHDSQKIYAAYAAAVKHVGQPTVILAKTVKGYGMGAAGEGLNITHQQKKMSYDDLLAFRDRFNLHISDEQVAATAFYTPPADSPEIKYLQERRKALGGYLPARRKQAESLTIPPLKDFAAVLKGSGERHISTTMAFVRFLNILLKDKNINKRIVPIVADESRTFGMEGMFRQLGIYSPVGQLYEPVDAEQVMFYHESQEGQILQQGINEGGAFSSWIAAATSYSNNNLPMIPFYIFYSMFGFQRIGDLAWAAGDMQARGFLIGGTAGRTTLAGEGLQHADGHSHLQAATIPNCIAYEPCFSYELAVIMQDGLRRMYHEQENIFYYITTLNENYEHPDMPEGVEQNIIKGMYLLKATAKAQVQLLGAGAILREVLAAAEMLEKEYQIYANVWSVTSFTELRREAMSVTRYNRLHPEATPKQTYVNTCLAQYSGPVIVATDYMQLVADQIRPYVPHTYTVLGTDGYGRSDSRKQLRHFFEVDAKNIVYATLNTLAAEGKYPKAKLQAAITALGIDPEKPEPLTV